MNETKQKVKSSFVLEGRSDKEKILFEVICFLHIDKKISIVIKNNNNTKKMSEV